MTRDDNPETPCCSEFTFLQLERWAAAAAPTALLHGGAGTTIRPLLLPLPMSPEPVAAAVCQRSCVVVITHQSPTSPW